MLQTLLLNSGLIRKKVLDGFLYGGAYIRGGTAYKRNPKMKITAVLIEIRFSYTGF